MQVVAGQACHAQKDTHDQRETNRVLIRHTKEEKEEKTVGKREMYSWTLTSSVQKFS